MTRFEAQMSKCLFSFGNATLLCCLAYARLERKKGREDAPFFLQLPTALLCLPEQTVRELPGLLSHGEQIMVFIDRASCRLLSLFLPQISRVGAPT